MNYIKVVYLTTIPIQINLGDFSASITELATLFMKFPTRENVIATLIRKKMLMINLDLNWL